MWLLISFIATFEPSTVLTTALLRSPALKLVMPSSHLATTPVGTDNLNILHLSHLGPVGIDYLTNTFNLSIAHASIPSIWKRAVIVAIPKPGKPTNNSSSYRPISLLCPAIKVLERLVLPTLINHLRVVESQHGFRAMRSTTSALLPLSTSIACGFNEKKPPTRTVALTIDFSRAFDTVSHDRLLKSIHLSNLPHNFIRWLNSYIRGCSASCLYNKQHSPCRSIHAGVPQGSVISPHLFNFYVSDFPHTADLTTSYADDFTSITQSPDVAEASLSAHAADVEAWALDKSLSISLDKSHSTLFTPDTHQTQLDPDLQLGNTPLSLEKHPKILGVIFDTHFNFSQHTKYVADRCASRLRIMSALAGTRWGQHKETLLITYRALIRSIILYGSPVWYPNTSASSIRRLQSLQNSGLRIATGSLRMSSISHLHCEAQLLPINESLTLQCHQYLLGGLRPDHPSYHTILSHPGPRQIKYTLHSRCEEDLRELLIDGQMTQDGYREVLHTSHSLSVDSYLANILCLQTGYSVRTCSAVR